jgi:hypothetical protein
MILRSLLASSIALCSLNATAFAEDVPPSTDAPAGEYAALRGVQGPKGMFSAQLLLNINMSADLVGKPISLSPDLYYAVSDKLQLGLLHQGALGWQTPPGTSLCLSGSDSGCAEVYNNVGLDVMYGLAFGATDLSLHGSLFFGPLSDPTGVNVAVGVAGKQHFTESVTLLFDPKIAIELSERDVYADVIYVPVDLGFQAGAPNLVKVLSGIYGPLDGFGDAFRVPLGLGYVRNINPHVDLGLRFSFDNLLGAERMNVGRADERSLALLLNLRS